MSEEKQKFDVLAVPINRPIIIRADKVEEFKRHKTAPELRRQMEESIKELNITDKTPKILTLKKRVNLGEKNRMI